MVKYFVTGGSGFIGSHVITLLKKKGYEVLALARSEKSASSLEELGAQVLLGSLEDLETLKKGARDSDGVIHLGFIHDDFSNMQRAFEVDFNAITAFEEALEGTNKTFIGTSGTLFLMHPIGTPKLKETFDDFDPILKTHFGGRLKNELYILNLKNKGIRSSVIRLSPSVHNEFNAGFGVFYLIACLKSKIAGYVGDGLNAWTSVHVDDAASLFLLTAENGIAGHVYHGIGEESVTTKDMAETIGKKFNLEIKSLSAQKAIELYGFIGGALAVNATATADITKKELGWKPKGKKLLEDFKSSEYLDARKKYGVA